METIEACDIFFIALRITYSPVFPPLIPHGYWAVIPNFVAYCENGVPPPYGIVEPKIEKINKRKEARKGRVQSEIMTIECQNLREMLIALLQLTFDCADAMKYAEIFSYGA